MTRSIKLLLIGCCLAQGCIPYTVGTTAHPAETKKAVPYSVVTVLPNGLERLSTSGDSLQAGYVTLDSEIRLGIDAYSDMGLRFPSFSGFVVNYKRVLTPGYAPDRFVVAGMVGGGIVNVGNHAYAEATLLFSGPETPPAVPYGGIRVMQVAPLNKKAVSDLPTIGVFAGLQIGNADFAITPELGLYYDDSALDLRSSPWLVVPGVSIRGLDYLLRLLPPRRVPPRPGRYPR